MDRDVHCVHRVHKMRILGLGGLPSGRVGGLPSGKFFQRVGILSSGGNWSSSNGMAIGILSSGGVLPTGGVGRTRFCMRGDIFFTILSNLENVDKKSLRWTEAEQMTKTSAVEG